MPAQPPGYEIAMADVLSNMLKMQQKMDGMEKELLKVRQENEKWKALDMKLKEDVSEGDEQEQEQEREQTQRYYMGSEASPKKSAHARDASEPYQPGEPPSPGMAQQQAPWSQDSDPWAEARKTWFQQGLKQGWTSMGQEKSAQAREAAEPYQPGENPSPGMAQQQWDWNSWYSWKQQNWNSGWRDSNWGSASYDGGRGDLKEIHHKDLKPPEAYGGNIDKWKEWSKSFMRYLKRRDRRWPDLLEKVQELKGKPVTSEDEKNWAWELYIYI